MSENSPNLKLPYILAAQAQKHVTHNEAVRGLDALTQLTIEDKDLTGPPAAPADGTCYIVASPATGDWAGHETSVAAFQDGAWFFYAPKQGWTAWLKDEDSQYVFDGSGWAPLAGGGAVTINPTPLVGVNATADTTNRLSVSSPATLLDNEGDDHQLKINKDAAGDNASVIFQTGYSGRAEFGLTGDDDFHMKVSPDGTTFFEGIVIDKDTGGVSFPNTSFGPGSGDEWGDAVDADIIPDADGTRDLGATATRFAEAYTDALFVTDNITVGGTVDGRDVAADGTKLDNIETAATADQTGAEIKALYEAESDTNAFTDADHSKLDGIEASATADQTGAEIATALFAESDTNNYDDAAVAKLAGIESSATADQTGAEIKALYEAEADTNAYDDAAVAKLAGIEANATADQTDEEIQDIVGAMLTGNTETRITVTYEDSDGTIDFVVDDDLANYDNGNSAFLTSVDASNIAVTSEARGDILFRGASGWERLAAGTSGQFLKTQSTTGDPVWDTIPGGGDMLASNNLSDVASASAARTNLGLQIGVDVAAADTVGSDPAVKYLKLRVAELDAGGITIFPNGILDTYEDETGVDLAASQGLSYESGVYSAAVVEIPGGEGTPIGDMTERGGLSAAFDGEIDQDNTQGAEKTSSDTGYIGKTFGEPTQIFMISAYSTTNFGWTDNTGAGLPVTLNLYGKTGSAPTTSDDGTLLGTETQDEVDSQVKIDVYSSDIDTAFDHVWVEIVTGGITVRCVELEMFRPNDMTLTSVAFTADSAPDSAGASLLIEPTGSPTLNTDLILSASRDDGVTWEAATLVETATFPDGTISVSAEGIDLSGQTSDTDMRYRIQVAAGDDRYSVHAADFTWSD